MMHGCDSAHPFVQDANMHECTWFAACPFSLLEEVCRRERCNMQVCTMHARLKLDCRLPLSSVYRSLLLSILVQDRNKTDHSFSCSGYHHMLMHMHICRFHTLQFDAVVSASNMLLCSQH